ncbi:MAG: SDR family oxidoreductase [archaeon]
MKSIVLGGTRGIGKQIGIKLAEISTEIVLTGRKDIDTSNLDSVKKFAAQHPYTDVLVLNTGGPEEILFQDATEELWYKYFNQLFLSFVILLQNIKINEGGYVFLISSFNIKEPSQKLILSSSLRLGFVSVFKTLSKINIEKKISYINIAPGPTKTDRLVELLSKTGRTIDDLSNKLPTKRVIDPEEIGIFVKLIVENKISSLNGVTINFDMGLGNYVL